MSQNETDKEQFRKACLRPQEYPQNLVYDANHDHRSTSYRQRLDERSEKLFCMNGKADVDVWEYVDSSEGFQLANMSSSYEIKGHFEGVKLFDQVDPRCRYIFIDAPHARANLRTSREMLMFVLTYYQVMAAFLDFIFPFGLQEYAQDFHFSGFREETHLLPMEENLQISELGRSGRTISMCFSLKSVEQSDAQSWPWSVRQTAAYHSFDVETGRSFWVLVKGNEVIQERIQASTSPTRLSKRGTIKDAVRSFALTLETHLILCEWSVENWRWYMNYLEEVLQDITGRSLAIRIGKNLPAAQDEIFELTTKRTFPKTQKEGNFPQTLSNPPPPPQPLNRPKVLLPPGQPPPPRVLPPGMGRPSKEEDRKLDERQEFEFHDLQQTQFIEEKMNEVLLVLNSNIHVLTELKEYYHSVVESKEWPKELAEDCKRDFARFSKRLTSIITELGVHRSRAEALQRLLGERKSLLYGILQYRNMEANMLFSKKAHESTIKAQGSADRMEDVTVEMHEIAKKTQRETVSMKIITVVTLFFLPGTFISVRVLISHICGLRIKFTIMSTDIVNWQPIDQGDEEKVYRSDALNLYLQITLPLTLLTFLTWGIFYQWVKRAERAEAKKASEASKV